MIAEEREAGTLEEFVEQLCQEEPGAPGSQAMDIVNAERPEELENILMQIWFNLFRVLQGDEELMERYMLSLGILCRFFDAAPGIPWLGRRWLRFEILRL
jgi:hypothetical protein